MSLKMAILNFSSNVFQLLLFCSSSCILLRIDDFPSEVIPIIITYIGTRSNNVVDALPPLFPVEFWNINERTKNNCFITNNCVDSWHRRFKYVMQCANPVVFKYISAIRKEQKFKVLKCNEYLPVNLQKRNRKSTTIWTKG